MHKSKTKEIFGEFCLAYAFSSKTGDSNIIARAHKYEKEEDVDGIRSLIKEVDPKFDIKEFEKIFFINKH